MGITKSSFFITHFTNEMPSNSQLNNIKWNSRTKHTHRHASNTDYQTLISFFSSQKSNTIFNILSLSLSFSSTGNSASFRNNVTIQSAIGLLVNLKLLFLYIPCSTHKTNFMLGSCSENSTFLHSKNELSIPTENWNEKKWPVNVLS